MNAKKLIIVVFMITGGFCFLTFSAIGQIVNPDVITFIGAEEVAANAIKVVFAVQVGQPTPDHGMNFSTIGSGFFAGTTNAYPSPLLGITCNHVVSSLPAGAGFYIGFDTTNGYLRFPCRICLNDPTNDIAIITPQSLPGLTLEKIGFTDKIFGPSSLDNGDAIVDGRGVLIVGYPLGLGFIGNENHPIVRFGMIAQNSRANTFLIDGMASHGNSGSPVIELSAKSNNLLGMVTSFENDSISLFGDHGELEARLPYNSGLSGAVKASIIKLDLDAAAKGINLPH